MTDRDTSGKFQKGNLGGPGRPRRATEAEYLDMTVASVPLDKWKKVVEKAVKQAVSGNPQARAWLADRIMGKPPQVLELHGQDAYLLAELLDAMKRRGLSAGELFAAMLAEIAVENVESEADHGE